MVVMMTAWEVREWRFSPRVLDQANPALSCSPCSAIGCSRWEEQVNPGLSCHRAVRCVVRLTTTWMPDADAIVNGWSFGNDFQLKHTKVTSGGQTSKVVSC
jgi:hypothetical protein